MSITLETDRLILKPVGPADLDAHCNMMADPASAEFLTRDGKPQPYHADWRSYASLIGHWEIRGFGFFSMFEKNTGEWVGRTGPWMPAGWPELECGWAVARPHWGKGYAPEAAIATIRWTFEQQPDLPRIISLIDPKNQNSQAVAQKIGETRTDEIYMYEGTLPLNIWACLREEWLARFGT